MDRRVFIKTSIVTAALLASQGYLPVLAAEKKNAKNTLVSNNIYTEPCAIEPVTGYLPNFSPAAGAAMAGAFTNRYSLVVCNGSGAKSQNTLSGTIDMTFDSGQCQIIETRNGHIKNTLKTSLLFSGEFNATSKWSLESLVEGRTDLSFTEEGTWDGKTMIVKAKSWTQKQATTHPLIHRWALLPPLASGRIKEKSLTFDMLDDSTLRPNQTLRYAGRIEVPIKDGAVMLDSYVQTGQGIVPTHYLVDNQSRVQLITMSTVNWALTELNAQEDAL